ncbi:MAG: hypothetical protein CMI18_08900 [Opitutaceae bacterium]|nr:hypothetical protein [Opitutaceae bacterium]
MGQFPCVRLDEDNKEAYRPSEDLLSNYFSGFGRADDVLLFRPTANAYKGWVAIQEMALCPMKSEAL